MIISILLKLALFVLFFNVTPLSPFSFKQPYKTVEKAVLASKKTTSNVPSETIISSREISLEKRYENSFVNKVFKNNILLNIAYMEGFANKNSNVNWNKILKPFHYEFSLKPNEVFAYHEDVLPKYQGKVTKTTNAHFNTAENFLSNGYLAGDGVCHLASLIYWAAKDASLDAVAPTNHDFAPIPQIPREFGVSIYSYPDRASANAFQNLYITNNKNEQITFHFNYDGENLKVFVSEAKSKITLSSQPKLP